MFEQCHQALCLVLEEFLDEQTNVDSVVGTVLFMLGRQGDDILRHLDPPIGLRTWLESHGLSLVPTKKPPPPERWEDKDTDEEPEPPVQERPALRVGDRVRYRTQAQGPWKQSLLGAGTVVAMRSGPAGLVVTVQVSVTERMHLDLGGGDQVEVIGPP